ncbi:hypothetical protein AVEN_83332-1 [Araneus ventricosus]|uniref:Uncharacterized protein n=1 Tax=Araneus ventricosus TaxID=182803 RepID=A0A4Y2QGA4_ARAVE|nr:hypothetical protein AVEN_83332-1 [Araneus ventricosus]
MIGLSFAVAAILVMGGSLEFGSCTLDLHKRTGWEPEEMGGWAAPMPMPMPPPKILLLKPQESSNGNNQKEDKISMLLPVIMALGPLIIAAIIMPIFMSLMSGIMSFIKSLLSMKMPMMMMPSMPMMIPPMMPLPMPMPIFPPVGPMDPLEKVIHIIGRKQNNTGLNAWTKMDRFVFPNHSTSALGFAKGF